MLTSGSEAVATALMLSAHARDAMAEPVGDVGQLAMHAFHDGVRRASLAMLQVIDGRRPPEEAYARLLAYERRMACDLGKGVCEWETRQGRSR